MALLAADTEAGLCRNEGLANSVVRGGGAAAVRTTYEMDPERVKRPAALAGRVHGRAELRLAKARAQCRTPFVPLLYWSHKCICGCLTSGCYYCLE